ncbi:MAG: L-aspartate oxidase [bacterium (Candidatus Ratteibacteria) CG_4_9_14_3_um_filter_41_21]|uniref:L-aspartate oxidase n=3 Tax=Candidatus Ratteibacteria TaxID=2979319 RepID=A0A2M7E7D1_9BACT|nr:MAG: L-aspartate oxidase [bacterium (Candidatus Ratteibacteria) CG01_land_8_20_14_3_00_40_19]PIW31874.1 MAG: L-aspartate oxidase [bacterium (Candidatus Ratteibacteria) CG15_BIG_FIL_POST_REV_8_21_14_020_41_12]PJA61261.1 MAG: L-aspartate oxidase [bacterium (Candidatus Ratteibacteria) CG_4_9_14_3_um_filter_41_21]HCG76515.1 L-aspartate oxidase [bacterium]
MIIPDYLVDFNLSRLPQSRIDVLIVGSGVAGLSSGLAACLRNRVLIIAKNKARENASFNAQGGIAVALPRKGDSWRLHFNDTIRCGEGLSDKSAVELLVREGPKQIKELIKKGANFDRTKGRINFTKEGAHSKSRIVHAKGDATGREIEEVLLREVRKNSNITIREDLFVIDLLHQEGKVFGAIVFDCLQKRIKAIISKKVILATGGAGQLYQETTNTSVSTGDGLALAYRAGASLSNLEFIQFHPTALYLAGTPRFLISESVRGEGAILVNQRKTPFMSHYHKLADLAPRDIVSRAILDEMKKTKSNCVYLDLSSLNKEFIKQRFPHIRRVCSDYGLDITRDLIPVRPAAHYLMGGIKTDLVGRTDVENLYACGETAETGVHGANRLASNSLLECLVFGYRCGEDAGKIVKQGWSSPPVISFSGRWKERKHFDLSDLERSLRVLMWRNVGIKREKNGLEKALQKIRFWQEYALKILFKEIRGWEAQNMLIDSFLITGSALKREESRGAHFRLDFPKRDDKKWKRDSIVKK